MARCSKDKETGLTDMQARFVVEYVDSRDLNAEDAAVRAGASPKSAQVQASKWLSMGKVRAAIRERRQSQELVSSISKEWWLQRQKAISDLDPKDLYDESGFLKPLSEMPEAARKCITKIKTHELFDGQGDQKSVVGFAKEIGTLDPQKALDAIGKHMGWLTPDVNINVTVGLTESIRKARERAKGGK